MTSLETLDIQEQEINDLLETAYQLSGYDFREYVRSALQRRIQKFLHEEGLKTAAALRIKLQHEPKTLQAFLAALTIDFTSMFRDASFFEAIRTVVVPRLRELPFIRIWHAGCASGEEVYSMAILLQEEGLYEKSRIYATDMNPGALEKARQGIFPIIRMKEFTHNYMASGGRRPFSDYYSAIYRQAILSPALQKNIVWARHNLTCEGKFNDFDLILCRNVLIYFNQDLKDRVHGLFHQSLHPGGILGLGLRETMQFTGYQTCYAVLDERQKIYIKRQLAGESLK